MENQIKIIIADDHQIFRDGLKSLLRDMKDFKVIAEVEDGEMLIEKLKLEQPDVILMDIKMPKLNGIEATIFVRKKYPNIKILALSMYDDERYIMQMLQAGALGYVLKNAGKNELIISIKTLAAGDSYFSKEISAKLFAQLNDKMSYQTEQKESEDMILTDREIEILKLIAEEMTNQQIADKLFISPRTVDTHRRNLLQKLDVKNTAGLVRYAMQHKLVD